MNKSTAYILGLLAPSIFVFTFTILGFIQHDFHAMSMYVSALSLGNFAWIQITNFLVLGIFLLAFAIQIFKDHSIENKSKAAPILLLISALCFLFSGPFVMDPMGTPQNEMTTHGLIHGILGGIVFMLMPITCFVFYKSFERSEHWKRFRKWTLLAAMIISTDLVIFSTISKVPLLYNQYIDYLRLLQRYVIVPYMVWLFTYA
jgi:Protein of unknown function (DUF998)